MRLWRRPAATAPIRLLAWEPPYATGAALEKTKRQKDKKKKKKKKEHDGREYAKKNVYRCMTGSLCCTAEIGTTL